MMAGWPRYTECGAASRAQSLIDRRQRDTGGCQHALPAPGPEKCIGIERATPSRSHRLEHGDVIGRVHALDCLAASGLRFGPIDERSELGRAQCFEHRLQSLWPLGMSRAAVMVPAGGI